MKCMKSCHPVKMNGKNCKVHGSTVVGSKGQIVIPSSVRKEIGIEPGDTMIVVTKFNKAVGLIKAGDVDEFLKVLGMEARSKS